MAAITPPFGTADAAGWNPTGAATLHEAVDDPIASTDGDTSYAACTDGTACELELPVMDHPNQLTGHVLRVSSRKAVDTSQTCTLRVELFCGATLIASTEFDEGASYSTTELTLSESEAEAITDYGDLTVVVTDVASPLTAEHRVSSVELEIPDRILRAHVSG